MGGINMGLGLVYSSFTLTPITDRFGLTKTESTMFNVVGYLCAMIGSIFITPFVNRFGKRWTGFCVAIYGIIVWIVLGLSQNKPMVFVFRGLTGMTIGLYSTITPSFIAEVAPAGKKNLFGFMNQIGFAIGFLTVTILGALISWRYTSIICCFPSVIIACGILFIPEQENKAIKVSIGQVCKYKKELLIAFLCMFFLQFSGINAVMSNMQIIITNAKINISTSVVGILTNIVQLIATCISAVVVDKLGTIACWITSASGQLIAFLLLCLHQKCALPSWVFMIGLFLEQLSYGIGTGPIPFATASNIFRVELRATAMSISGAENWGLGTLVVLIWPYLESGLTLGYAFLFFLGIQILSIIFGSIVFRKSTEAKDTAATEEESNSYDEETENMKRKLSYAGVIPEL
ncbi:major facilitator superfamily protein [Trichomonas vaginalis G3]|uniref:Major facilitator superfamily protein n=1 Tax=Trichomonas vaginalis (strain ATCC PRA-98 / G3) TaxID=412133 RepID=A2DFP3_TRIV3|nr:major facilitator superfamily transporter [Trichomonas vaginalis G3]EAY20746.1 major facilitator superfamily protein [Trichomonas vaginalis G3]KAI5529479.1 glucose import [Trichomonas vaginalis G3]|eukprot:XP_001581732.1 major facilitator superfamily transporter [Trichomonas vaginalis G3]